jgi:hypothetical protein
MSRLNYGELLNKVIAPVLLLILSICAGIIGMQELGLYPDELVDAQNAVALIKQSGMNTQIVEYNKLSIFGVSLPIYGIKPYNGTLLAYVLAVPFLIFGISPLILKLSSIILLSLAVYYMQRAIEIIAERWIAFSLCFIFVFSPFFLHFLRFDHGPLRLSFLLFWVFIYLFLEIRRGNDSRTSQYLFYLVSGLGLYNHVVFILPLIFGIIVAMFEKRWRAYLPNDLRSRSFCLILFFLPLLPFLFDLSGFITSWLSLVESAVGNKPALGGRSPFADGGLGYQALTRIAWFVAGRDVTAYQMEFGKPLVLLPYYWVWTMTITFVISVVAGIAKGCFKEALSAGSIIFAGFITVGCALLMPFIGSMHHMIYVQCMMVLALAVALASCFRLVQTTSVNQFISLAHTFRLTIIIFFIGVPILISANYYHSVATMPARGLFSSQLLDVKAYIRNDFQGEKIITYGWGTHSYMALLFGGVIKSEIYQSPKQLGGNVGLFQIDADGGLIDFKPDNADQVEAGKKYITLHDLERRYGLKVEKSVVVGDRETWPLFLLAKFAPLASDGNAVLHFSTILQKALRTNTGHLRHDATYLKDTFGANGQGQFSSELGGGYIGYEASIAKHYILLSGVTFANCVQLIGKLRADLDIRAGEFGNSVKLQPDSSDMSAWCKSGNMWFIL